MSATPLRREGLCPGAAAERSVPPQRLPQQCAHRKAVRNLSLTRRRAHGAAERLADRWSPPVTPRRLTVPAPPLTPCPFCQAMPNAVETSELFDSKVTGEVLAKRTCLCGTLATWR